MRTLISLRIASVLVLLALTAVACETVPVTGRSQIVLMSADEESKLGVAAYQDILGKARLSTDPAQNELVRRVGSRIAAVSGLNAQWEYKVIEDKQANAFALPGGKIAVYTGMFPVAKDEAGLAAVLGHEVAHVTARHSGERMSQQVIAQMGFSVAAACSARARSSRRRSVAASAILLPFGRSQESEADHIGLVYMAQAGYDPHAARDLWIRMGELSRGRSSPESSPRIRPRRRA